MMEEKKIHKPKAPATNCESCIHYVFDEDYADYACEVALDEDEMLAYAQGNFRRCPYYQFADEYINVRKQI